MKNPIAQKPGLRIERSRSARILRRLKESWQWYVLLLPALIYLVIFEYGPIYGVQIAFRDYRPSKGFTGSEWVWFKHFIRFLKHPMFFTYLKNTLSITLLSLATFPCAIIFALLLNEVRRPWVKKTIQMATYLPHFLSEVVVCSLVILFLDKNAGPINHLVELFGGERANFLNDPEKFATIYVLVSLWQSIGWSSILYMSALSSVSQEVVEAAEIDGASRWQIMTRINLPSILPTIIITLLLQIGKIMSLGYTRILLLQTDLNIEASTVISTYSYTVGLLGGQYSYSAAIGLFNNVVNIIAMLIANKISKKVSETSLV